MVKQRFLGSAPAMSLEVQIPQVDQAGPWQLIDEIEPQSLPNSRFGANVFFVVNQPRKKKERQQIQNINDILPTIAIAHIPRASDYHALQTSNVEASHFPGKAVFQLHKMSCA